MKYFYQSVIKQIKIKSYLVKMLRQMNCWVVLRQGWNFVINKVFVGGVHGNSPTSCPTVCNQRGDITALYLSYFTLLPSSEGDAGYDDNDDNDHCRNFSTFFDMVTSWIWLCFPVPPRPSAAIMSPWLYKAGALNPKSIRILRNLLTANLLHQRDRKKEEQREKQLIEIMISTLQVKI